MIVLCVLSFAPLACLRLCQFSHAITHANVGTTALCSSAAETTPAHDSLINDIQRVLAALTDCIPALTTIVAPLAALELTVLLMLMTHFDLQKNPTPPPRCLAH